jgi:hypothetical protein
VEDHTTATILLTHIPLYKEAGVCFDAPFFDFYHSGDVKEQNHLSAHASKGILEGVFGLSSNELAPGRGLGRNGIIVNGHDHEGCDVVHYINRTFPTSSETDPVEESESTPEEPQWQAVRTSTAGVSTPIGDDIPNLREITLRSMMGEFGGYAGFLSAWFDESLGEHGEWTLEYTSCSLGIQHYWWAVHILDLVGLGIAALTSFVWVWERVSTPQAKALVKDEKVPVVPSKKK